jgi:hypothetical protein
MDSVQTISKAIDGKVNSAMKESTRKMQDKVESVEGILIAMMETKVSELNRSMS